MAGTVQLDVPAGWQVVPTNQTFHLARIGDHKRYKFTVTAPPDFTAVKIIASAEIGGVRYQNERKEINYPHIPLQLLQPRRVSRPSVSTWPSAATRSVICREPATAWPIA